MSPADRDSLHKLAARLIEDAARVNRVASNPENNTTENDRWEMSTLRNTATDMMLAATGISQVLSRV